MNLRSKLAITCAKATSALIKKLNRGSGVTLPGYVARLIDPKILTVMSGMVREKTIVTMGTNGKTTTNSILYHALKAEGKKVIINRTGAKCISMADAKASSQAKGETLEDTIRTVDGYVDAIVMRHPVKGAAVTAANIAEHPVINGGDGAGQHHDDDQPVQGKG